MQTLALVGMVDGAVSRVETAHADATGKEKRASALELLRARLAGISKVFGEAIVISDSVLLGLIDSSVAYKHAAGEFEEHRRADDPDKSSYPDLYPELATAKPSKGSSKKKKNEQSSREENEQLEQEA